MGNYNPRPIKFRQSLSDFPLTVSLGDTAPAWGLSRWNGGGRACGLRFVPPDDEGFTLRGDKKRLVYKGRRRSHRFTILGDTAFEYDCILEREPESNVISLLIEGAEQFDFFRQPDFLTEPLLAGSYAVYKKETLIGEGTGKLCHIHRPEIIDAKGRRVWGDLTVVGNELRITIPENWLSEAVYPVVVDPTIGTTTVGSQTKIANNGYDYEDYPWLENQLGLNKFTVSQGGAGMCTAYIYASYNSYTGNESVTNIRPCLFTNNNNKPYARQSRNENEIDVIVGYKNVNGVRTSVAAGWRIGMFSLDSSLQAGTGIWFGGFSNMFTTKFDYGGECYRIWPDYDLYPEVEDGIPPAYVEISQYDTLDNYKFSWYFTYTAAQNYVRTLTQGVTLADNRKLAGEYKRITTNEVKLSDSRKLTGEYKRITMHEVKPSDGRKLAGEYKRITTHEVKLSDSRKLTGQYKRITTHEVKPSDSRKLTGEYKRITTHEVKPSDSRKLAGEYKRTTMNSVQGHTALSRFATFPRKCLMTAHNSTAMKGFPTFLRFIVEQAQVVMGVSENRGLSRQCVDSVKADAAAKKFQRFYRKAQENVKGTEKLYFPVMFLRIMQNKVVLTDNKKQWVAYIRGLRVEAASIAETTHGGEYYRFPSDTVQAQGTVFRFLLIFIKLLTTSLVRDYLLRRFLKSNEELVLKSYVCRNIILDSKIH